jgi:hypothetical protein
VETVTGVGQCVGLAWSQNGNFLIGCDTVSGQVRVLDYAFGALTLAQSIPVSAVAAVAIALDSADALVCQPTQDTITPLTFAGSAWVSGTPIAIANPTAAVALSQASIAIGNASGVTIASLNAGIWTLGATTAIGFVPQSLATDGAGNVFAVGASGGSGVVYASGHTATFIGTASGVVYSQAQLAVADHTGALRIFSYYGGAVTQQSSVSAAALTALCMAGDTLIAAANASFQQYEWSAPWTVVPQQSGAVAVYNGSLGWATTLLGVETVPMALAFSGLSLVHAATLDNALYTIAATGGVAASAQIFQASGQTQNVPIGIASLIWAGTRLYGTSSLCEAVVEIV